MAEKKNAQSCCELCANYIYDEEIEGYVCDVNLDEDELVGFLSRGRKDCPFFRFDDEYAIVRK